MEINRYMGTLADLQRFWSGLHQGGVRGFIVGVVRRQHMRTLIMRLFHVISARPNAPNH